MAVRRVVHEAVLGIQAVDTAAAGQDTAIPLIHRADLEAAAAEDVHNRSGAGAMRGRANAVEGPPPGGFDMADIAELVSQDTEGLVDSRGPTWLRLLVWSPITERRSGGGVTRKATTKYRTRVRGQRSTRDK